MGLQDYDLHGLLGTGATATVHRAVHVPTDTLVALKQVATSDPRMVRAVEQEIRAMARVGHPNLLSIYDHGRSPDHTGLWLAIEHASGGSLEDWLPDDWEAIWEVLDDVLHGLAHAHARGLVHRDLKPENLLLATQGDVSPGVKIGDFGLTTLRGLDPAIRRGGTPLYMAPEQWQRGATSTPATDLYALGCILWQWSTGHPPFQGTVDALRHAHTSEAPSPLAPRFDVPDALPPLLAALLEKAPEDRPATAGEIRRALRPTPTDRTVRQMLAPTLPPVPAGMGLALLPLRDHRVVGQESARHTLARALERVSRDERPEVWILSGPPGIGKTRLAPWIAETAAEWGVADLLVAPSVADAQLHAETRPTLVLFDDVDPDIDIVRLRALVHTRGPLLAVACMPSGWHDEELEAHAAVHRLELGPMGPQELRWFLRSQLGLTPQATRRIEEACQGVPGIATAWVREFLARGALHATKEGFALREGPLPPPPPLHDGPAALTAVLCEQAEAESQAALRMAAMLGDPFSDAAWEGALGRQGLDVPEALLRELAGAGLILRESAGWRWSSQAVRETALSDAPRPAEWLAVAESLDALPTMPARTIRAGLARLAAGDVPAARRQLLVRYPLRFELIPLLRTTVEALRPHLEHATATERVLHTRQDMATRLNLDGIEEALTPARTLVEQLGTESHPGPLRPGCDPRVVALGLATAAAVFAHAGQLEQALALLEGQPSSSRVLRVRSLVARKRGALQEALALASDGYRRRTEDIDSPMAGLANDLGMLSGALGDHHAAEAWFRRAMSYNDPDSSFYPVINIAVANVAQGRPKEAVHPARRALVLAERAGRIVPQAYVTHAIVAALAGRTEDVRRFGDTALAMLRSNPRFALAPMVGPARSATSEDPIVQRFLDALRPLLQG